MFSRILYLSASIVITHFISNAAALPTADHHLSFLGRVNPQTLEFSWPATGVSVSFLGTQATVSFSSQTGTNSIAWLIDDNPNPIIIPSVNSTSISTPVLPCGQHTAQLIKKSEALFGSLHFGNVTVTHGNLLPSRPPSRRLEFIGDSITVGYGEDGTAPCINSAALEDATDTYAAMTARNLSAARSIVAVSGRGLTRNYVTPGGDTAPVVPELWTRYGADDADGSYTFPSSSTPDAVVVNLGTNDYSYLLSYSNGTAYGARLKLNVTAFEQAYLAFVQKIIGKYPSVEVFLCSSPMLGDGYPTAQDQQHSTQLEAIKWVAGQIGSKVHVVDFPTQAFGVGLTGCDAHPGPEGHAEMARILIPTVKGVLGW